MATMLRLGDGVVELHSDLMSNRYTHGGYIHFRINDPKPREIHKAMVHDRLLHHAIHRKLYPFFEQTFIADSFSCQLEKGVHKALNRFCSMTRRVNRNNTRTCWILKCDIRKFFASIDHKILIEILRIRIADSRILSLLEDVIQSFEAFPGKGLPLGNLTSQLFANIYMNEFDQFIKNHLKAKYYIRYADDFVFLSHDRVELECYLPKISVFLAESLELHLHPDKVFIKTLASGVDFLGWIHFPHHRIPRTKTKQRMFERVRCNPDPQSLASYLGLLSHGDAHELQERLMNEHWLWH